MKIAELFAEGLKTAVLVKGDLTILPNLIQKTFGLKFKDLSGACLASQFIFTLAEVTGLNPQKLLNSVKLSGPFNGVTFQDLFTAFDDKVIKLGKSKQVKFKLSLEDLTIDQAIESVKDGQPVTAITSHQLSSDLDVAAYTSGIYHDTKHTASLDDSDNFHALLLIGYDAAQKTVIFREMRSIYAFKGFVKIPLDDIVNNKSHFKFIATIVDDYEVISQ